MNIKIYLIGLFLSLLIQHGFSQNDTLSVEEKVHQIYENLDLSTVQPSILLDKGLSFLELDQYHGDPGRDSVYIFRQVANLLQRNRYSAGI